MLSQTTRRHYQVGLRWTAEGRRGRPKTTRRRSIEREMVKIGYTWGIIERKANNREDRMELVLVLCANRHSKD